MTQETTPTTRTAIKYGFYVGIASVILYFLINITGLRLHPVASMSNIILIVGLVFAMREYKNLNQGFMTYGQGLGIGTMLSSITGFMVGIFIMIFLSFNPQVIEQDRQRAYQTNESFGESWGLSDEEIDQQNEISASMMTPPFYFMSYLFLYLIVGFIFTLIIAAFQRKNRDIFDELDAD